MLTLCWTRRPGSGGLRKQAQQLRPEAMSEFDLIGSLQQKICLPADEAVAGNRIGIGDDCAVFEIPSGHELLVCTDTLVEGVHFPTATRPEAIGHKALAVNLSDLAAMGAQPAFFLLALTFFLTSASHSGHGGGSAPIFISLSKRWPQVTHSYS